MKWIKFTLIARLLTAFEMNPILEPHDPRRVRPAVSESFWYLIAFLREYILDILKADFTVKPVVYPLLNVSPVTVAQGFSNGLLCVDIHD
jgi:hypothetical protein